MRLLYDSTGKIHYAVADRDWFFFSHTSNASLSELEIDELDPVNKAVCQDLMKTVGKFDADGLSKYYLDTATNSVMERGGWAEEVEIYG